MYEIGCRRTLQEIILSNDNSAYATPCSRRLSWKRPATKTKIQEKILEEWKIAWTSQPPLKSTLYILSPFISIFLAFLLLLLRGFHLCVMIASSSSPNLHSQHGSPRNAWNRPSSLFSRPSTLVGMRRRSASTTLADMRSAYSRSPRLTAHLTRDASTQYSSPETPESERSSVTGKRKDRAVEGIEVMGDQRSPPKPQLTPQIHATAPASTNATEPPGVPIPVAGTSVQKNTSGADNADTTQSKKPRPLDPVSKIVPISYEDCPTSDLVPIIASMLMELIRHNDDMPVTNTGLTRFHSRAPPGISVHDYLQRLTHHATLSPPILLCMVYYIDRLCSLWPKFTINSLTVHRYLITSATVASKGLSDSFWTNSTYARVGGVSLKELALLELEFLWRIEWRIVPNPEVLVDYYKSLVQRCDGYEIRQATADTDASDNSGDVNVDIEMSK